MNNEGIPPHSEPETLQHVTKVKVHQEAGVRVKKDCRLTPRMQKYLNQTCKNFGSNSSKYNPQALKVGHTFHYNTKQNLSKGSKGKSMTAAVSSRHSILPQLEQYVERELVQIALPEPQVSEEQFLETKQTQLDIKLQVFREALSIMLQKLEIFYPLLIQIKNAYEAALEVRDTRIKEIDVLKKSLLALEAKAEEKMAQLQTKGQEEIAFLVEEKFRLLRRIDQLKEERNTQTKIVDKLRDELTVEHTRLLEEIDCHRLLSFDIHQLRQQMEMMRKKMAPNVLGTETESLDDPKVLRLALTKCSENLTEITRQLDEMKANYTEVVPKREMTVLEEDHKILIRELAKFKRQIDFIQQQYQILEEKFETIKMECNQIANKNQALEETGTPRPDWEKCAEFVKGGIERWRELIQDKSSDDRLKILLVEMSTEGEAENEFLYGRGLDDSVPPYLRYEGKMRNRRLSRRDLSILINDIWQKRVASGSQISMQDFVTKYFITNFHLPLMQFEWAYSMVAACEKLVHDNQIGLFWGIINGQINENVYHSHIKDLKLCKDNAKKRLEFMNLQGGVMPALVFSEVLRSSFPFKNDKQVVALVEAASRHVGSKPGEINVHLLFEETEEGVERTEFSLELTRQTKKDHDEFVENILKQLGSVNEPFKLIAPEKLKKAINSVDSSMSQSQVDAYLNWVYGENLKTSKPVMLSLVTIRLQKASVHRVIKRQYNLS